MSVFPHRHVRLNPTQTEAAALQASRAKHRRSLNPKGYAMPGTYRCDDCDHIADSAQAITAHCRVAHGRKAGADEQTPEEVAAPATGGLIFDEPPPSTSAYVGRSGWSTRCAPLKAHPDTWARVAEHKSVSGAKSSAPRINRGLAVGMAKGDWEARGGTKDGKHYMWVRYVGGES